MHPGSDYAENDARKEEIKLFLVALLCSSPPPPSRHLRKGKKEIYFS